MTVPPPQLRLPPPLRRRSRKVLEQTAAPLIPLRPLTIGECMDAAYLLVRRNLRSMLGVPAAMVAVMAAYLAVSGLIVAALGNTTWRFATMIAAVLCTMLGFGLFSLIMAWLQFLVSRASLQTVFGEDVGLRDGLSWRGRMGLLGPALLYVCYLWAASSLASGAATVVLYLLIFAGIGSASVLGIWGLLVMMILGYAAAAALLCWLLSWVSLVAPIYVAESELAPDWVGRPAKPTSIIGAIGRNFSLLGWKNSLRLAVANAGAMIGLGLLVGLITYGIVLAVLSYLQQFYVPFDSAGVALVALSSAGIVTALTLMLFSAYFAALQLVFYLDVRMRREGLDLAMRFSVVPVPEPGELGAL